MRYKFLDRLENEEESLLEEQFLNILETRAIHTVFQPIISLRDGTVFAIEALSRGPKNTLLESPNALFDFAQKCDKLWDLELLCRSKALEATHNLQLDTKLFLNINPTPYTTSNSNRASRKNICINTRSIRKTSYLKSPREKP